MSESAKKIYLGLEFVFLFFGLPLLLMYSIEMMNPSNVLIPIVMLMFYYLKRQKFHWEEIRMLRIPHKFLVTNIILIFLSALLIFTWVYLYFHDDLFNLPNLNFKIWIFFILLYPLFSASLQEIIYRVFMFRRYKSLFVKPWMIIVASGIAFSFAHIFYLSVISLVLTFIMGVYLAYLYLKTRSFLLVALIHSFYGIFVFTVGLGEHFWIDMHKYLI